MASPAELLLRSTWGGREDSFEAQVDMMWECMMRLRRYGGFLADPWECVMRDPYIVSDSKDELRRFMTDKMANPKSVGYSVTQYAGGAGPHVTLRASPMGKKGYPDWVANHSMVDFEAGERTTPLPVEWLLGYGRSLVTDMVEVWHPDAVSLDSMELIRLSPVRHNALPMVGFMSWFSDAVLDGSVLPGGIPVCERFAGGTLVGIDPGSADPVGDASRLALWIYGSGMLRTVPCVQGQPDPIE